MTDDSFAFSVNEHTGLLCLWNRDTGLCWSQMVGGGYFVSMGLCKFKHSASADLNSDDTFENVFLFPDFRTALVGDFCPIKRVIMEKAFPGKIPLADILYPHP